jgi:urease accessory protein
LARTAVPGEVSRLTVKRTNLNHSPALQVIDLEAVAPENFASGEFARRQWRAKLQLWFALREKRTVLTRRQHSGPLVVQRPFYPEKDGTCHVYLLHPPGGVVGGDELNSEFFVGEAARCLLTTPAATKFYGSGRVETAQKCRIEIAGGAVCEYLPQESIVYDGANTAVATRVDMQADATYVGWDIVCLGRAASKAPFKSGSFTQKLEIIRDGKPVWIERLRLQEGSNLLEAPYALAGKPVFGTMIYAGRIRKVPETGFCSSKNKSNSAISVTQMGDIIVCRYLGHHAEECRQLFTEAWHALRMELHAKGASSPRIWAT